MAKFDARDQSTAMDSFCSFDGVDFVYQQNQSRPIRARHSSSSALLDRHTTATKAPPIPRRSSEDSGGATKDITSLNQLWNTLRQQKQRQMAKEPPKVNSLKAPTPTPPSIPSRIPDPVGVRKVMTPQPLKRRKSNVSFRESRDGRTVTATFDLPGIKKNNAHVSYRGSHLTVTWETVKITEIDEGGTLVREREKKEFSRTIPLPEGTKFEEVGARMDDRYLILTYPNMRSVRVEPRQMGNRQVEPRRIEPTEIEASDVYEY
jgi:HSP20 family molecular chaperone IbpA